MKAVAQLLNPNEMEYNELVNKLNDVQRVVQTNMVPKSKIK